MEVRFSRFTSSPKIFIMVDCNKYIVDGNV